MKSLISRRQGLMAAAALACTLLAPPSLAAADTPQRGGTLNLIAQPEPPLLVVGLNTAGPTLYVGGQIYQSLLGYDRSLKPTPSLARSWTVSADALTYSFRLQPGVKWHDGKPFSADDVLFSATKFMPSLHPRWRLVYNNYVAAVTAPAPDQVVFKLKKPFSAFIHAFDLDTLPILPKHLYDGTDYATNPANQTPIGTGPFKLKEWKRGAYIHLVRNEAYWKPGQPYLDEIFFHVIPDAASRAVAFEKGTVDVLRGGDVEGFELRRLARLPKVEQTTAGWENYSPLVFLYLNQRSLPLSNQKVRQALAYAVDRDFIVKNIFFGLGKPATGPVASTTAYYSPAVTRYDYDLARAKKLIAESGIKPGDYTLRIWPVPFGPQWTRVAEYLKQQVEQLGFKTVLQNSVIGDPSIGNFDFDIAFNFTYQYGHPALGVARHYLTESIIKGNPYGNNGGYANPEVDRLFAAAATAPSEAEAAKLYAEVQKLVVDDAPITWLFELHNVTLYRSKVHGLIGSGIGLNHYLDGAWIEK